MINTIKSKWWTFYKLMDHKNKQKKTKLLSFSKSNKNQPWTRPEDRAMSKIAASFSSWGKTRWINANLLLKFIKKSSNSIFLPLLLLVDDPPPPTLHRLAFTFIGCGGATPTLLAAAAMARLAFLCLIPHALQRDYTIC